MRCMVLYCFGLAISASWLNGDAYPDVFNQLPKHSCSYWYSQYFSRFHYITLTKQEFMSKDGPGTQKFYHLHCSLFPLLPYMEKHFGIMQAQVPFFNNAPVLLILLLCFNIYVITNFSFNIFARLSQQASFPQLEMFSAKNYGIFFGSTGLLCVGLVYILPSVSICLLPIALGVSLRLRSTNLIWKSIQVVVLSIIAFLLFFGLANPVLPSMSDPTYSGLVVLIYLGALFVVFLTSVLVNYGRGSLTEIVGAFGTITAIVLTSLMIFTDITFVYSIAIAFLTFLALGGGLLYRHHDENATWVARAWLVLGVFSLVGYLSRSFLFVTPDLQQ